MSVESNYRKLGNVLYVSVLKTLVSVVINFIVNFYKKMSQDRLEIEKNKAKNQLALLHRSLEKH